MDSIPANQVEPEVHIVTEWHDALNGGDVDRLLNLSHPDVEVGGPRGIGRGSELLRDWANHSGIRLTPRRFFRTDKTVVAEQEAAWTSMDTGEATPPQTVASVLIVRDGRIASVVRYDNLAEALSVAGLDESHGIGNA